MSQFAESLGGCAVTPKKKEQRWCTHCQVLPRLKCNRLPDATAIARARSAPRRIIERLHAAISHVRNRAEPDCSTATFRNLAAAKAVAAFGSLRKAGFQAARRLSRREGFTSQSGARNRLEWVVRALRVSAWEEIGRLAQFVTARGPVAVVVARPIITVKVTVELARPITLPEDSAEE